MFTVPAILGVGAIGWGLLALRHALKGLSPFVRYSPVWLIMLGASMVWHVLAAGTPVIVDPRVELLSVGPRYAIFRIQITKVRDCQFNTIEAFLKDNDGALHKAKIEFINNPTPGSTRPVGTHVLSKTLVVPIDEDPATSVVFQTTHTCAFDIPVRSVFGETSLPTIFNQDTIK